MISRYGDSSQRQSPDACATDSQTVQSWALGWRANCAEHRQLYVRGEKYRKGETNASNVILPSIKKRERSDVEIRKLSTGLSGSEQQPHGVLHDSIERDRANDHRDAGDQGDPDQSIEVHRAPRYHANVVDVADHTVQVSSGRKIRTVSTFSFRLSARSSHFSSNGSPTARAKAPYRSMPRRLTRISVLANTKYGATQISSTAATRMIGR